MMSDNDPLPKLIPTNNLERVLGFQLGSSINLTGSDVSYEQ
jgi:hypothetical protein